MKKGLLLIKKKYLEEVQALIKNKKLNIENVNEKLLSFSELIESDKIISILKDRDFFLSKD